MINVKCVDCEEYRNEWCDKIIDSSHPDMLRDCQYFHEKDRDLIKVIRCKDCELYHPYYCEAWSSFGTMQTQLDGYCYKAVKREGAD